MKNSLPINSKKVDEFSGNGVSPGVILGSVRVVVATEIVVQKRLIAPNVVENEQLRLREALAVAIKELEQKIAETHTHDGTSEEVLNVQLVVLGDELLVSEVGKLIREEGCNAEYALQQYIDSYCARLVSQAGSYFAGRTDDIRDITNRLLRILLGHEEVDLSDLSEKCILVAHDLSPSETATMDRENVLAFVTEIGSRTSHTAIMARALDIPAVVGVTDIVRHVQNGDEIIVDGTHGTVTVNPGKKELKSYRDQLAKQKQWQKMVLAEAAQPAETKDGFRITFAANVELPEEVIGLREAHNVDIGLFRTEFLFLRNAKLDDEEVQYKAYREAAEAMNPRSVIFRTLDIGGDKFLSRFGGGAESNPFLGMRAIRFSLACRDIFRVQLRAILRASHYGKVRIMFPMISTLDELLQALEVLEEVKKELDKEGIPFNHDLDVGMMIEVPSAALIADTLAQHVDFFSIGTNDLVQYTLAVDRSNQDISYLYQPAHPAIIRLVKQVVDAAYAHGKWVGMCGEMASDPLLVPLILGMGIHEISMSPVALNAVKRLIRHVHMLEAEELVKNSLRCGQAHEVVELCREFVNRSAPGLLRD